MQILDAARELFEQEGYDRVSIRRLSGELGIASGTIYNYFSGKEDIYFRIISKTWIAAKKQIIQIMALDLPEDQREEQLVRWVYQDSKQRRRSLLAAFSSEWRIRKFGERWVKSMQETPEEIYALLFSGHPDAQRHGVFFLYGLRGCLSRFPEDDEKNISYLLRIYRNLKRDQL